MLKDSEQNFSGEDVREGLTAIVSIKIGEPQFESESTSDAINKYVKCWHKIDQYYRKYVLSFLIHIAKLASKKCYANSYFPQGYIKMLISPQPGQHMIFAMFNTVTTFMVKNDTLF